MLPVAVIGGGFSGAMTAVQLSRSLPPDRPIQVFERGEKIGTGVAYGTGNAQHLLNVRASNMSAFPDEPGHFEAWLKTEAGAARADWHETEAGVFSSRRLYARYIADTFARAERPLTVRRAVADCRRTDDGFLLTDEAGQEHAAAAVILATGHVLPSPGGDSRHVTNPWDLSYLDGLDPEVPILVLGTALTMVDILLILRQAGHRGEIVALSRRGALSLAHRPITPWPTPDFTAGERATVRGVMRRLRREAAKAASAGVDWRAVIDSIRPITVDLWAGWDKAERLRFLRHARRWWDIHRHRMAPPNAEYIERERQSGGLSVIAGRLLSLSGGPDGLAATWRLRSGGEQTRRFQRVINATGLESLGRGRAGLIDRLLGNGLVRLDPLGIGLDVTDSLAAIGAGGTPVPGLWAVGPIVRGTFWECIAVPDIRRQAADCAARVADYFAVTSTVPVM